MSSINENFLVALRTIEKAILGTFEKGKEAIEAADQQFEQFWREPPPSYLTLSFRTQIGLPDRREAYFEPSQVDFKAAHKPESEAANQPVIQS